MHLQLAHDVHLRTAANGYTDPKGQVLDFPSEDTQWTFASALEIGLVQGIDEKDKPGPFRGSLNGSQRCAEKLIPDLPGGTLLGYGFESTQVGFKQNSIPWHVHGQLEG